MIYVKFSSPINPQTAQNLMNFLIDRINLGEKEFYFLISSPGGTVNDGVVLYNFIKALPVKIVMHNIGIIDSIANVVFLSSPERYCTPNSSFLFHGVGFDIIQPQRLDEKELREKLLVIERDQKSIAGIISERTKLTEENVMEMFFRAKTKNPIEAKDIGMVHEIKAVNIPENTKIFSL